MAILLFHAFWITLFFVAAYIAGTSRSRGRRAAAGITAVIARRQNWSLTPRFRANKGNIFE